MGISVPPICQVKQSLFERQSRVHKRLYLYLVSTWEAWSVWSECSLTCGINSVKQRTRICGIGVGTCEGMDTEEDACALIECRKCKENLLEFIRTTLINLPLFSSCCLAGLVAMVSLHSNMWTWSHKTKDKGLWSRLRGLQWERCRE